MKKLLYPLLAVSATCAVAAPALAMESTTFADDNPEAAPVVSVRVEDSDPDEGVCTGTAIAEHWVITARHCVEAARKPAGSVRTGQGHNQKVYEVDRHEVAPEGDIALLHAVQPMQLDHFAEIADSVPSGAVNIYGWSSDGSGGSTRLPAAEAAVEGESPMALFGASSALHVSLKNGARIQPGDSGGAIFADGKVAGIMSAGLFEDPDNPSEQEMSSNAAVSVAPVASQAAWIRDTVAQSPESADKGVTDTEPGGRLAWFALGLGALAVIAAVLWGVQRRKAV